MKHFYITLILAVIVTAGFAQTKQSTVTGQSKDFVRFEKDKSDTVKANFFELTIYTNGIDTVKLVNEVHGYIVKSITPIYINSELYNSKIRISHLYADRKTKVVNLVISEIK